VRIRNGGLLSRLNRQGDVIFYVGWGEGGGVGTNWIIPTHSQRMCVYTVSEYLHCPHTNAMHGQHSSLFIEALQAAHIPCHCLQDCLRNWAGGSCLWALTLNHTQWMLCMKQRTFFLHWIHCCVVYTHTRCDVCVECFAWSKEPSFCIGFIVV